MSASVEVHGKPFSEASPLIDGSIKRGPKRVRKTGRTTNLIWTGLGIVRRSVSGLMDTALPKSERELIQNVLRTYEKDGLQFHAVRTRDAGARKFVSMHVLVPGNWTVNRGHRLLQQIERKIQKVLPHVIVFTHLEPLDDPASWQDEVLDHSDEGSGPVEES
jgi:divalent metal cation (Fe/Co/Zn/Cd) transporter